MVYKFLFNFACHGRPTSAPVLAGALPLLLPLAPPPFHTLCALPLFGSKLLLNMANLFVYMSCMMRHAVPSLVQSWLDFFLLFFAWYDRSWKAGCCGGGARSARDCRKSVTMVRRVADEEEMCGKWTLWKSMDPVGLARTLVLSSIYHVRVLVYAFGASIPLPIGRLIAGPVHWYP